MRTSDFSERHGLEINNIESLDNVSPELKTATWNVITDFTQPNRDQRQRYFQFPIFVCALAEFFNVTNEQIIHNDVSARMLWESFRPLFYNLEGKRFYDLINFISKQVRDQCNVWFRNDYIPFSQVMNIVLGEKRSPCEFIEYELTLKLTSEQRVALEESITTPFTKVNNLLKAAATLLFEGKFEDSSRKAIDAVETLLKSILQVEHINFGRAIEKVGNGYNLNGALITAQKSFWGYVSQCARHSTIDQSVNTVNRDDAKYILNWCAGLVNYIMSYEKNK